MRSWLFVCLVLALGWSASARAEEATTTPPFDKEAAAREAQDAQLKELQIKVEQYQKQLDSLGSERKTLQQAINALTLTQQKLQAQIKVTEHKISGATSEIQGLTDSIGDTQETIASHKQAIAKSVRLTAQNEDTSLVANIFSSHTLGTAWRTVDEAIQLNAALLNDIANLHTEEASLAANREKVSKTKSTLVSLQQDLNTQKRSIIESKEDEQELLTETKNQESNYQRLLAEAKAELESFSVFAQNAGGSKLLRNQTSCDDWGCYYSQRDAQWGNIPLNNTRYKLASDGCLVTAMAMVLTHYGHRTVTPVTINANAGNFASYYPPYLLFTIRADGATAVRQKIVTIDSILEKGDPVVVGVHAYGGTHYVVFTSGSKGNYLMRDPYVANGKDIAFTAHYSLKSIFSMAKVVVNG